MDIESNVARKTEKKLSRFDFSQISHGSSVWFANRSEVESLRRAFGTWKLETKAAFKVESEAVGHGDPKGRGYRAFFYAEKRPIKPVVLSTIRKNTMRDGPANILRDYVLTFTGLHAEEDVVEAVMSVEPPPQTISEASTACRLLWTGETPRQLEYCLQTYGRTLKEIRAEKQAESLARENEFAERKAAEARRLAEIKREEAAAMAELERELGERD